MTIGQSRHRSLFLSDFHLGSRHCKAERLYKFLYRNDADLIYLVGDIIDCNTSKRWPAYHDAVLGLLADKALNGTQIVYIPGNHDAVFRHHIGKYANLRIANHIVHECVNGKMILITHGDETDLFKLDTLLWFITKFESVTGLHLWEMVRRFFKALIVKHTASYETKMMTLARDKGFFGVVCGHVHMPCIAERDTLYLNSGDWTWHCTAIGESFDGSFHLLRG